MDVVYLGLVVLFFVLSWGFIRLTEHL